MNKIIIDADPGVDDAFAIILAAKSQYIDLLGITVVDGNCSLSHGINNTFKILDLCNKSDIPVYRGAKTSLIARDINATSVHGENGFGNLEYVPIKKEVNGDAVDYLIETVNNNPNEITLVAIGPLTNIALAINKDKNFSKNIKSLIIMGGSTDKGNITPDAEFNIYKDPEAAKIVFEANIKDIIMIGLNVTNKCPLKEEYEQILRDNRDKDVCDVLYKISRVAAEFDRSHGLDGLILNDPINVAYLIDNSILELKNANVDIIINGEKCGKTDVIFTESGKHKVAIDVNSKKFYKILFDTILN